MFRKVLGTISFVFISTLTLAQPTDEQQRQWVDSVYNTLTFEQRIGQMLFITAYGSGNEKHHDAVASLIRKYNIGGLVFTEGNATQQVELTNRYQKIADVPLLIGINSNRGLGSILSETLQLPNNLTLGALQDDKIIYDLAYQLGQQMKVMGIHFAISPSGIMASEKYYSNTFGTDPNLVANKALAYTKGLQANGVMSVAKYYPGYFDNGLINNLPDEKITKKSYVQNEIIPFKILANNGVDGIVVSHAQTKLDVKKIPSSLSANTLKTLKNDLSFNGLIFSDALDNKALIDEYKSGKLEALAFAAGNDVLLNSTNVSTAIKQIKRKVNKGEISRDRVEASVKKILAAKFKVGLSNRKPINQENLIAKLNNPMAISAKDQAYRKSITVIQQDSILPILNLDERTFASLSIGNGNEFRNYLNKYNLFSHYDSNADAGRLEDVLALYDYVIIGLFDDSQLLPNLTLINQLSKRTKVIVCSFVNPFSLNAIKDPAALVVSYSNELEFSRMAPEIIFGGLPAEGRLPLSVSGELEFGSGVNTKSGKRLGFATPEEVFMDSRVLNKIDLLAKEAISEMATPGCQIVIARRGKIVFNKAYGYHTYDSLAPVDENTIYDLASITKIAATTQALMFLEERQIIDMDKKISVYLPELKGTNKEHMILRDILTHQAGLWPFLPFWQQTNIDSKASTTYYSQFPDEKFKFQISDGLYSSNLVQDSVWQWVKNSKLREKKKGEPYDYKYSDMGYYMLKRMIERLVNQPMEDFLQQNIYDPMGLSTLSYLPLCKFPQNIVAPTEHDNYFRKTLVYGLVHDQGAAMLGGVAGHAGLFSNALDLAKLMQMNLQDGSYGGQQYFMKGTVERFTKKQYDSNRRGMGWDKPVPGEWNSPTSRFASKSSFGHTGFTGTAAWVDPEFDLVYVFLSNRIYPDAENKKLIQKNIRTRIQDLIYQSIWSYSANHLDEAIKDKQY